MYSKAELMSAIIEADPWSCLKIPSLEDEILIHGWRPNIWDWNYYRCSNCQHDGAYTVLNLEHTHSSVEGTIHGFGIFSKTGGTVVSMEKREDLVAGKENFPDWLCIIARLHNALLGYTFWSWRAFKGHVVLVLHYFCKKAYVIRWGIWIYV